MLEVVNQWVSHYGYVLVALFLFIEAAGVPVPGETALVTAAALAGRGTLSIFGVLVAGTLGTIAGGHAGYWLGVRGGHTSIVRHGKWIGLTEKRLERTQTFFAAHGANTVLLGRFVAVVRSFIGILAGLAGMPQRKFAVYNAAGAVVWVAAFSVLGYVFGRNLPRLVHYIGRVSLVVALLIAVVAGVVFLSRWFARNRTTVVASLDQRLHRASSTPRMSRMRLQHPRAWQMLWGRYAHGEYLAVHLGIGFVISVAVIAVFASITEGLVESSPLTRFDIAIAARLQQSASPAMLQVFSFVSSLGGRGAMTMLLVVGGLIYAGRRRGLELAGWIAAFIGGSLLDAALRFVVRRSELPFADVVLLDWGTGLASGHALGVLVGYGMLAYLLTPHVRGALLRGLIIVLATAMVVGVTISRLYLGQHYISDAAAGLAAGFVWLAVCISGIEVARQRQV
jgi:membrane protein DedA with SNARE-associated domain/membrane-associated phospholipid phosphatase